MYDVTTGQQFGERWKLPARFVAMRFADGKFVLVCEERENPGTAQLQSVAYDWDIGKEPKRLHVVRRCKPGDESGYYRSDLTPDGRYFWWSGPRKPEQNSRCEVLEVATGKPIKNYAPDTSPSAKELTGYVTPDGRVFYVTGADSVVHKFDLTNDTELQSPNFAPVFSEDMKWMTTPASDETLRWYDTLAISRVKDDRPWLELVHSASSPFGWAFCHNGTYLAWSDDTGGIYVAGLPDLEDKVREFEKQVLSK
jgi:hypothetical protein